jgi:dipeptidyl-peptidase-4
MMTLRILAALWMLFITTHAAHAQKQITLEEIWLNGMFSAKGVQGFNSMKDGKYYTAQDAENNIIRYAFATGKAIDTLLFAKNLQIKGGFSYTFSEDEQLILIQSEFEQIYRHSFAASITIYNRKTGKIIKPSEDKLMLAEFSPNSKMLGYVKNNNLYVYDLDKNKETEITNDGKANHIINGSTDWVYEEEFSISKGFYWSPNSSMIAYYRFDETNVKEFNMAIYGTLYPEEYRFKYPKAGEDNSIVNIFVYDLNSDKKLMMDTGNETDIYLPRIAWTQSNQVLVQRMNRLQNKLEFLLTDPANGKHRIIYTENNSAYIDIPELYFTSDAKSFIINSEMDGYNHLYQYDMNGKLMRQLTKGNWEVDKLYGIDEKKKIIYISTSEVNSTERYIYAISLDGKIKRQLTTDKGWNSATFNADFTYFLHTVSTLNTPPVYALRDATGKLVRTLENNQVLLDRMKTYATSDAKFEPIENAYGEALNMFMIKPANFDASKQYPILMYVYGGPGHQLAVNRWMGANYFWFQMLAQKGYIVVCADGRGTGFRGEKFKKVTYLQLGKYEIEDQIFLATKLGKRDYIDASRIGMFGWSFGGYMSSLAITKGADVFKTAIAVAPVTNWRYYDNIYTERFMRTPQENGKNYDDNSPINFVDKIKGNYLIIHGTADDNVHFQNAAEMVSAMINKNVKFDSEFYPNKNHGIGGGKTRYHLYERMTRYLLEKL